MIYKAILSDDKILEHHGILGMHWGVRRFQNYDGTRIGGSGLTKERSGMYDSADKYSSNIKSKTGESASDREISKTSTKIKNIVDKKVKDKDAKAFENDLKKAVSGSETSEELIKKVTDVASKYDTQGRKDTIVTKTTGRAALSFAGHGIGYGAAVSAVSSGVTAGLTAMATPVTYAVGAGVTVTSLVVSPVAMAAASAIVGAAGFGALAGTVYKTAKSASKWSTVYKEQDEEKYGK